MSKGFSVSDLKEAIRTGADNAGNNAIRYINEHSASIENLPDSEKRDIAYSIHNSNEFGLNNEMDQREVSQAFGEAGKPIERQGKTGEQIATAANNKAATLAGHMTVDDSGNRAGHQDLTPVAQEKANEVTNEFKNTAVSTEREGAEIAQRLSRTSNPNLEAGQILGENKVKDRNVAAVAANILGSTTTAGKAAQVLADDSMLKTEKVTALDALNGGGTAVGGVYNKAVEERLEAKKELQDELPLGSPPTASTSAPTLGGPINVALVQANMANGAGAGMRTPEQQMDSTVAQAARSNGAQVPTASGPAPAPSQAASIG